MYRSFFGLNQLPFKISPDLEFFYKQASREEIAHALVYSIERGDGIIKVVGEVGVGKTTLLRMIAEQLSPHYQKIYVNSPNMTPVDFLRFICDELSLQVRADANKSELLKQLNQYLIQEHAQGRKVVMLIDESQSMTLDTLEEIRLLGNLETAQDKLLQLVLFGQPELDVTLADVRIKPLKDRIACNVYIPPLDPHEVMRYLNYRMRIAGYLNQDLFDLKLSKKIQKFTKGLPRSINLVADKLLMIAFSQGDHELKAKHFKALDIQPTELDMNRKKVSPWWWGGFVLVVALLATLGWVMTDSGNDWPGSEDKNVSNALNEVSAQANMTPVEMARKLGVSFNQLHQFVLMHHHAHQTLSQLPTDYPVLLTQAKGVTQFLQQKAVFEQVNSAGAAEVMAFFEIRMAQPTFEYAYGLLWVPNSTDTANLTNIQNKLQAQLPQVVAMQTAGSVLQLMPTADN